MLDIFIERLSWGVTMGTVGVIVSAMLNVDKITLRNIVLGLFMVGFIMVGFIMGYTEKI